MSNQRIGERANEILGDICQTPELRSIRRHYLDLYEEIDALFPASAEKTLTLRSILDSVHKFSDTLAANLRA